MRLHLLLFSACVVTFSHNALAISLNAQEVGYNIDARGARTVVAELGKAGQLMAIENNIKMGDDSWIALAPKLAAANNTKFNQGIKSALSSALTYNPAAVLKVISNNKSFRLSDICTAPADAKDTATKTSFQKKASSALSTIKNNDMINQRNNCLAELAKLSD